MGMVELVDGKNPCQHAALLLVNQTIGEGGLPIKLSHTFIIRQIS